MSPVVVDTDVASLVFKESAAAGPYTDMLDASEPLISFMTLAELHWWRIRRSWGVRRTALLDRYVSGFQVIYCDAEMCRLWAEVRRQARIAGKPIDDADAWVAATALLVRAPLLTRNLRHYAGVRNLELI